MARIGGAVIGTLVGAAIGEAMDEVDQACLGQVLERAPIGIAIAWRDPDHGTNYNAAATSTFKDDNGRDCREYQVSTVIGGKVEVAKGTACRSPDGTWEKVN